MKKTTQRFEEEIEEEMQIGAESLQVMYCFVDRKYKKCILQKIYCYHLHNLDMCI